MKYLTGIILLLICCTGVQAQLKNGDRVTQITIRDARNQPMILPWWGEKCYLIFYPDPDHASQNKEFIDWLKAHPINSPNIFAFGVVNLRDAPFLPNAIIRMMVRREVRQTGANIYTDVNNTLSGAWNMGDVNNKFCIIFINRHAEVEFYHAGEMNLSEQRALLDVIAKNK
ncbi:hypothetical protein [Chitinophaga solisilvae]|uniref:hypothetical protein n=1 Tax=Chitinophaga solisilvae TaxID=1233460 RepID=UPI00136AF397|nr:hypothetical protein [Chitinophaga solisilvae]